MNTTSLPDTSKLLTKEELAIKLRVSTPTINNWMRRGMLKATRIGKRVYFSDSENYNLSLLKK